MPSRNEDGTVKMVANPPSHQETWAAMEKVLASGKVKVYVIYLLIDDRLTVFNRTLVSPTSQLKRTLRLSYAIFNQLIDAFQPGAFVKDCKSCPRCESNRVSNKSPKYRIKV